MFLDRHMLPTSSLLLIHIMMLVNYMIKKQLRIIKENQLVSSSHMFLQLVCLFCMNIFLSQYADVKNIFSYRNGFNSSFVFLLPI